jgi:hypothetical protein
VFRVVHVSVIQKEKYSIGSEILQVICKFETFVNQNEPAIGVAACGERWRCKTGKRQTTFRPTIRNCVGLGSDKRREEGRVTAERQ